MMNGKKQNNLLSLIATLKLKEFAHSIHPWLGKGHLIKRQQIVSMAINNS